jgi:hypothetical protein
MKDYIKDNGILWRYCGFAASQIQSGSSGTGSHNFKCNVCGDGKGNKKRGHLIWDKDRDMIYYKCWNVGDCSAADKAWSGARWLKTYFPVFYKQYTKELFNTHKTTAEAPKKKARVTPKLTQEEKLALAEDMKHAKSFKSICKSKTDLSVKAQALCIKRRIPEEIWHKFFIATDGIYRNRMIIPFFDKQNQIYYYQARDLVGNDPKYLNRKLGKDDAVYNYPNIDKSKPVCVFEGPIDSMFVENSIAVMGLAFSKKTEHKLKKIKSYYLLDNDHPGFTKSLELLKKGECVFLWKKFLKDNFIPDKYKDMNDVYIYLKRTEKFKFEELSKYFTDNYLDSIYLR